jgi:hypothetical protein
MGVIKMVSAMKKIHPDNILLIEIGKFYYVYGKDAFILSYIFKYKLVETNEKNIYSCAFPKTSYSKVIATLENKKINYIIVDRKNNYDVDKKSENKNLNTYNKWYEKSKQYINVKCRADKIYNYLIENFEKPIIKEKLKNMEDIINETRKISSN